MRWACRCCSVACPCRRTSSMRTVKSRGPDTPTLVSALMRKHHALRWPKSPAHRGEREAAVPTIARGMPDVSAEPVVPAACIFFAGGPWVRPAPGIPRALCLRRAGPIAKLGRESAPREGELMSHPRHCELGPATKSRPAWDESGSIYLTLIEGNGPTFFLGKVACRRATSSSPLSSSAGRRSSIQSRS